MRIFLVALLWGLLAGAGHAETLYFIHVDHLGTPRLAVGEDGVERWRWDQLEPFGDNPPIEVMGPEGYLVNLPLRFPGQYHDKETNLHYNYFRDYDPGIGRYMQSDPIGLGGGQNTYFYVRGDPLRLIDPLGLKELCPPGPRMKKCLEELFGESIDVIQVTIDPPMVFRHHGEDAKGNPKLGATTRSNNIYINFPCDRFWGDPEFVLHEYYHVIQHWGREGMTIPGYLLQFPNKEREAEEFAENNLQQLKRCLSCSASE